MKTRLKESHYETPRMRDVKTWTQEAVFAVVITGLVAAMSSYDFMSVHKVDFDGIAPDSAGTVTIKIQGVDTGTRADAHFNGLRIAKQL